MEAGKYIVLILGAGASRQYDVPVMREFLPYARRRYFQRKRNYHEDEILNCYSRLFEFYDEYRGSVWSLDRDWDNIEELYTQADLLKIMGTPDSADLCGLIAWAIWDMYRQPIKIEDNNLASICEKLPRDLIPVVITTNYDLVVEKALINKFFYPGLRIPDNPVIASDNVLLQAANPGLIPIIKLHGSVNWYSTSNGILAELGGITEDEKAPLQNIRKNLVEAFARHGSRVIHPGIIPPTLGKHSEDDLIALHWLSAVEAISMARQIWVIGYSFPQTDTFMSRLLTEGLRRTDDLDFLGVVDVVPQEQHGITSLLAKRMAANKFVYSQGGARPALTMMNRFPYDQWREVLKDLKPPSPN